MKLGPLFGIVFAIALHAGFLLFGGLLFLGAKKDHATLQEVELLREEVAEDEEKEEEPETTADEAADLEAEPEEVPDAAELLRNLEQPAAAAAPALEAASLSALEAALNGQAGGGGDFAQALSLASGGRIGGIGKPGALDQQFESAFSLAEIDQKPRAVFQSSPAYPAEMRGKKVEGVVTVIFVVDAGGKVASPSVEKSNHAAFNKPALDAVKQWKFEPAVKGGQRVPCKMRVPIRFPSS